MDLVYNVNKICKDCNDPDAIIVDYNAGDVICSKCGFVLQERCLDSSAEWRSFKTDGVGSGQDKKSRERADAYGSIDGLLNDCCTTHIDGTTREAKGLQRAMQKAAREPRGGQMQYFVAANTVAQLQKTDGVGVRRTMRERDVDETRRVKWGDTVRGRVVSQWLVLGDSSGYLPITLDGKRVLLEAAEASGSVGPASRHWGGGLPPRGALSSLRGQPVFGGEHYEKDVESYKKKVQEIVFRMAIGDNVTHRCIALLQRLADRDKLPKKKELTWACALVHLATIEEKCTQTVCEIAQANASRFRACARALPDGTKPVQKEPMEKSGRTLQSEKFETTINIHVRDLTNILGLARHKTSVEDPNLYISTS